MRSIVNEFKQIDSRSRDPDCFLEESQGYGKKLEAGIETIQDPDMKAGTISRMTVEIGF